MTSFWPILSLCGSSILFAARRSSKGTLNLFAMLKGVSPFATTYVFLLSAFGLFSAVGLTGIAFRSSLTADFVVTISSRGFAVESEVATAGAVDFWDDVWAVAFGVETGGRAPWRLLIALKAMMPATATTWRTSTIRSARDNFMLGSDISS